MYVTAVTPVYTVCCWRAATFFFCLLFKPLGPKQYEANSIAPSLHGDSVIENA